MVLGAVATAVAANLLGGLPWFLIVPLSLAAGCLVGALWALGPAWLQTRFEVPLLITTLLLNYVAIYLAAYLAADPLRDLSGGAAVPQTVTIPEAAQLPLLPMDGRVHIGVVVLLILPIVVWWFLRRTVLGYELRMTGHNPFFAEYGGVDRRRTILRTMLLSGAICGAAGALVVLGVQYRYLDGMITTAGWAWTGFTAALLAAGDPLGTLVSGVFLIALEVGAASMERQTDVPLSVVEIVQAAIILMVAIRLTLGAWLARRLRAS
jgi:simple sugar transport system permease protein